MLILGGGVSGLSAAYYLLKNGVREITLAEASNRLGGWIRSIKDPSTGLVFEKGPRTLRVNTPSAVNTLSLIEELGIESKIRPILKSNPASKNRLIYVNGRLCPIPTSFSSIFKKNPPFSRPLFFAIFKDLYTPMKKYPDDNVYNFVERRFGSEIADFLISPLICGICAGDAKEISVNLLMPGLFEYEQTHGSVIKGLVSKILSKPKLDHKELDNKKSEIKSIDENLLRKARKEQWNVYGMEGGLVNLPDALKEHITKDVKILLDSKVSKLSVNKDNVICTIGKQEIATNHIVSSISAKSLAPLLANEHPKLAADLASIPYVSVCVVNLAYKGKVIKHDAFGFLVPPSQNIPLLGVIFDTCSFPQGDWTVLTAMLGGKWIDKHINPNMTEEDILRLVNSQLKSILDIKVDPDAYHVSIMRDCIPQYIVGHSEKVKNIHSYIKDNKLPITLVGASFNGIGVNDSIYSAKIGVEELLQTL